MQGTGAANQALGEGAANQRWKEGGGGKGGSELPIIGLEGAGLACSTKAPNSSMGECAEDGGREAEGKGSGEGVMWG